MLMPRDTPSRERKSLNGLWRFALDTDGSGHEQRWWSTRLPGDSEVPVPASFNDLFPDLAVHDHVGEVWYQAEVRVPKRFGDRVVLRLDAATHAAVVWVNDTKVMEHQGGYTPFEADVTSVLAAGEVNRITVAVDNRLSFQTIPPGRIIETSGGPRQQYFHDFFNYGGLHRTVWLYTTPASFIDDITVVTGLDGSTGTVEYRIDIGGDGGDDLETRVVLRDADGTAVARATGPSGELRVADVRAWRPGEGHLYELTVELGGSDDAPADVYSLPVGIRSVQVDGTRFLINGEPFYFKGFGKHEDSAVRGKAHDDAFMVHDFALMEWLGANSFRTSHYPYAEEVLEYADRHGIVVIGETPAVGINSGLAAGAFGAEPFITFSDDTINATTQAAHAQAIRELIERDKNHPSVVLWSIANEPESTTPEARAYFEPLAAEARKADPTRPIGFVSVQGSTPDLDVLSDMFDVVMVNRYYGWYEFPGDLASAERALEAELNAWAETYGRPIIITEYGGDAMPGVHGAVPAPWSEEYQAAVLAMCHRVFDRVEAVVGEQVWNFADFATAPGVLRVDGNKKGVFTRDRRPKAAAYSLQQRWRGSQ
jgi:beta-glucuronidase